MYLNEYTDYAIAYSEIGHFSDEVYQSKRFHSALGSLTPSEFESAYQMNLVARVPDITYFHLKSVQLNGFTSATDLYK